MKPLPLQKMIHQHGQEAASLFGESLRLHRYVILEDHGIDPGLLEQKMAIDRSLFALPTIADYKAESISHSGYFFEGKEYAASARGGDKKRMWQMIREFSPSHPLYPTSPKNIWPQELPTMREIYLSVYERFDELSRVLLDLLERYLEAPTGYFLDRAKDGRSLLRTNYYPPLEQLQQGEYGAYRANEHTDVNFMTIMPMATDAGFQIRDDRGEWRTVDAKPGSLIVVTGRMMMVMTNTYLKPAWHRVIDPRDPTTERWSMPFFVHPKSTDTIEALPQFISSDYPTPLPRMTRDEFVHAGRENTHGIREWVTTHS